MSKIIRITGYTPTIPSGSSVETMLIRSSSASLNLDYSNDYIFIGTSVATWNLPNVTSDKKGRSFGITVKNNGTKTLTIPSEGVVDGSDNVLIPVGFSVTFLPTGTNFTILTNT